MQSRMIKSFILAAGILAAAGAQGQARPEPSESALPFGDAAKVGGAELAKTIGSADLSMVIAAKNSSNVSNNVISGGAVTGGISFDQAALSNLSGLSVLSANTGNNVAINSSLNLNVAIRP